MPGKGPDVRTGQARIFVRELSSRVTDDGPVNVIHDRLKRRR